MPLVNESTSSVPPVASESTSLVAHTALPLDIVLPFAKGGVERRRSLSSCGRAWIACGILKSHETRRLPPEKPGAAECRSEGLEKPNESVGLTGGLRRRRRAQGSPAPALDAVS